MRLLKWMYTRCCHVLLYIFIFIFIWGGQVGGGFSYTNSGQFLSAPYYFTLPT